MIIMNGAHIIYLWIKNHILYIGRTHTDWVRICQSVWIKKDIVSIVHKYSGTLLEVMHQRESAFDNCIMEPSLNYIQ